MQAGPDVAASAGGKLADLVDFGAERVSGEDRGKNFGRGVGIGVGCERAGVEG